MPYLLISTQIRLETGPTLIGDEFLDQELAVYLGANLKDELGNNLHYVTESPPRVVLDKLAIKGYKVVSSCGIGQTCAWTLYKEDTV